MKSIFSFVAAIALVLTSFSASAAKRECNLLDALIVLELMVEMNEKTKLMLENVGQANSLFLSHEQKLDKVSQAAALSKGLLNKCKTLFETIDVSSCSDPEVKGALVSYQSACSRTNITNLQLELLLIGAGRY